MTIRVRGIYATALTELFGDGGVDAADHESLAVVQASDAIDERFESRSFPTAPATATAATTDDRQGVGLVGTPETVAAAVDRLRNAGVDALAWRDPTPKGAVYDGVVRETLDSGAVVELGGSDRNGSDDGIERGDLIDTGDPLDDRPLAAGDAGFLPYGNAEDRIDDGDRVRVQVDEPRPPWSDDRPVLDTSLRVDRSLLTLRRGGVAGTGGPHLGDVLPIDPPEGWGVRWAGASEEASLDALGDALERAAERATAIDDALAAADERSEGDVPARIAGGRATAWVWFGRESRFGLDDARRRATATMPGHHRTKAGADAASTAVDFVESLCPDLGDGGPEESETDGDGVGFPFETVTDHFGPREGDRVAIHHGKPDGRLLTLGRAEVTALASDGTVELERELTSSGTYDGLGTPRERGDVATTKVVEGRWWYPTVYRSADGDHRGTYVNVCTPVEVFPEAVRYVDLHVDVVKRPDGEVERLDDDELDAAEAEGYLPAPLAEKARTVASAVERAL